MNDLKTINDALEALKWKGEPSGNPKKGWVTDNKGNRFTYLGSRQGYGKFLDMHNKQIDYFIATLSRMIETPALQTPASDVAKEPFPILPKTDGREHRQSTVIILGQWFLRNYYLVERALQPTYWMPLPAPICKSCTNGMSYGVDGEYPCPKCHGNNAPTEKVERIEGLFDAVSVEDLPPPNTDEECENIVKRYHDHANIYGCDVSQTLLKAARAHLKLQSGYTEKVDLDGLKLVLPYNSEDEKAYSNCALANERTRGWNACIDHLANTGRLR